MKSMYQPGTKHVINGNSGGPISASAWKNLITLLESKGYTWCAIGPQGTFSPTDTCKCPKEMFRYLIVNEDKTLTFGQPYFSPVEGHPDNKLLIKLNDFKKLIK